MLNGWETGLTSDQPEIRESIMGKAKTFSGTLLAISIMAIATPAGAIECEGNFQIQKSGKLIATPYCQDENLARVAREYGVHVSGQDIRHSFSVKRRTCRLVGYDNRVRDTCSQYLYRNRRGRCGFIGC